MDRSSLKVIPLGGLGEIGKNMMVLEYADDILVVDCGVLFPDEEMPGADLVIPNISYLGSRISNVRGIIITHGHEDHIGALPYVLPRLGAPVYAPAFAHSLIRSKLEQHNLDKDCDLLKVQSGDVISLGQFEVEFFRVCHSIPDSMGLAIRTPVGLVVHTGDFKMDHTPVDGQTTDLAALARYQAEGILLLLSDSTYAEMEGYTPSEQIVGDVLHGIVGDSDGRVMVATFASQISRIQQIMDAAVDHHRKIAIVGRSMVNNVELARAMGYIGVDPGVVISLKEALKLPPDQVLIVMTGSQGEPTSALVRIANATHPQIKILRTDTIVISASAIPGNEKAVSKAISNLSRLGARVLYDKVAQVHVHGHASREELKLMLDVTRPQLFVPIHGEHRHMEAHADLASDMGIDEENIFVLEDGDVLEVTETGGRITGSVEAGHILVDGLLRMSMESSILSDRRLMAQQGVIIITLILQKNEGLVMPNIQVLSRGVLDLELDKDLCEQVAAGILASLGGDSLGSSDLALVRDKVRKIASEMLYKATRGRPMIIPITMEI